MRLLRRLSIRARITVQTLVIALVLCSAAAILFGISVQAVVRSATAQLLANDAGPFEADIRKAPTDPSLVIAEDQQVAVINPSGAIVLSSLPRALRAKTGALLALDTTPRDVAAGSHTYLGRMEKVRTDAGTWRIVSVRDQEQGDLVMQRLTVTLLVGDLALVVGFGIAAWLLTGAALRPVNDMRRDAERLSEEESLDGLPIGEANDEIARLAGTLNAFIDRNRQTVIRERQMISDASHELRTPLGILSAQLELAESEERTPAEVLAEVAEARDTVRRLSTLTTNLLTLARLETGNASRPTSWPVLAHELTASVDRARVLAQAKSVSVDYSVVSTVEEDRSYAVPDTAFASVIDNLVINAISAVDHGGHVHVSADQSETAMTVSVTDDGPGLPPEFIPIAFDRFTRPDEARQRDHGGSGLGLAIVSATARAAGGDASIRNTGTGLEVTMVIPPIGWPRSQV
ncbi:MAG TPA: ATP-binding protein [Galbitalea sp.]